MYEVKATGTGQGDNKDNDDDNSIPTVVYEYAYSDDSAKLARDSARHLLLSAPSYFHQLQPSGALHLRLLQVGPFHVTKVTWSHWELDMGEDHWREVSPSWAGELDNPQPDRDVDEDCVQPAADAFMAVDNMGEAKYHMRAAKVAEFEVCNFRRTPQDFHLTCSL